MSAFETVLFALALAATAGIGIRAIVGPGERGGDALLGMGAAALAVLVASRWARTGHPPLFGTFEAAVSDAAVVAVFAVFWRRARPEEARLARASAFMAAAVLAHGVLFPRAPLPLTISERSLWVELHAAAGFGAFGCFAAASVAATARLARAEAERLDELQYRLLSVAFLLLTGLIAAGAWYGEILFDSFWRWDPIECLAAIAWLSTALLLHAYLFFGWRGRRLAVATLLVGISVLLLYKGIPHLSRALTFHNFDLTFD